MPDDNRPICTAAEPKREMRLKAKHPNARSIREEDDHGDELWECPDCGYRWWREGDDG